MRKQLVFDWCSDAAKMLLHIHRKRENSFAFLNFRQAKDIHSWGELNTALISVRNTPLNRLTKLQHNSKLQVTISQNKSSVIAPAVWRFALQSQVSKRVGTVGSSRERWKAKESRTDRPGFKPSMLTWVEAFKMGWREHFHHCSSENFLHSCSL